MVFDFSIFLTKENLIFFAIYGAILLVVTVVLFLVVRAFFRFIKNIFKKLFHKEERMGKDSGQDVDIVVQELQESKEERQKIEQARAAQATVSGPAAQKENPPAPGLTEKEKGERAIEAKLEQFKGEHSAEKETLESKMPSRDEEGAETFGRDIKEIKEERQGAEPANQTAAVVKESEAVAEQIAPEAKPEASAEKINVPQKAMGGGFIKTSSSKEQAPEEKTLGSEKEKGERAIEAKLEQFKGEHSAEKETLESKMPSRDEEGANIPRAPKAGEQEAIIKEGKKYEGIFSRKAVISANRGPVLKTGIPAAGLGGQKQDLTKEGLGLKESAKSAGPRDTSIFEGKESISRDDLRQKLSSPKMYEAERSVGLSMSPLERADLEKQVFSTTLGENISRTDLKWGLKKLNEKMVGSKNMAEKEKLRKEIKFFKKIGGVKQ